MSYLMGSHLLRPEMRGARKHLAPGTGSRSATAVLMVLVIALLGTTTPAHAAVPDTFTGWGYTTSSTTSTQLAAWRWDTQAWQSRPRPAHLGVYIYPFAAGWSWTWDRSTGWLAMRTSALHRGLIPGPETTGVPSNIALQVRSGDLNITTDGTVIDGWDIRGNVTVNASNVTIRRSIIRGRVPTASVEGIVTNYGAGHTNLLIEDSTIVPQHPSNAHDGFKGANVTMRRVEIADTVDGIGIHGNNVRIESSWIHDLHHYAPYALQPDNQTHNDGVQIHAGSNIVVHGNVMNGAHNAAIMVTPNTAPVSNLTIDHNYFDGGGCSVNVSEKNRGPILGLNVSYNRFGAGNLVGNCAMVVPLTTRVVATFTGNVWDYSGTEAVVRRG